MPLFGLFDGLVSRFNDEAPSPKPLRRADLEAYALLGSMIFGTDLESEQDGSYVEDALTVANAALTAPRSRGMEYLFFAVAIVAARLTEQQKAKDAATHAEGDTQKPCQPCPS